MAYVAGDGNKNFVVLDGKEGQAFDDVFDLRFSPVGSRLAYVARQGLDFFVVDGDKATGRWYITEHLQFAEKDDAGNPTGMFNIGVYQDRYVRENGEWLFSERHYGVLYNDGGKGNMSGTVNPYPELIK